MEIHERRLFDRIPARFPTRFRNTSDYGTNVFLQDVSGTGVRITTRQRLFIDDMVALEVQMPDGFEPVVLNGQVRWAQSVNGATAWEVGVEFHEVDFMRMHRLVRYALSAQNN